ncbi:hypothetical protein BHE74_00013479 [Ensete ventricosum]|nr:hypothetical protein BHE74_00013479 [Ensete ventricosum]
MGNGRVREKDNGEGCVEVGRTTLDLGEEERAGLLRLLKARRSAPRASRAASRPSVHEVARSSDGGGAHRTDRDSDRPACHGPPGWDTWLPSVWLFSAPVRISGYGKREGVRKRLTNGGKTFHRQNFAVRQGEGVGNVAHPRRGKITATGDVISSDKGQTPGWTSNYKLTAHVTEARNENTHLDQLMWHITGHRRKRKWDPPTRISAA